MPIGGAVVVGVADDLEKVVGAHHEKFSRVIDRRSPITRQGITWSPHLSISVQVKVAEVEVIVPVNVLALDEDDIPTHATNVPVI